MRPLISYYGGKQRMSSKIIPLIPKHTVYVEPFCGGASVFFAKPWPDISNTDQYLEILNDKNGEIINLYKCFQDKEKAEKLIHRLQFTLYSRKEYQLRKEKVCDDVERAARFYCDIQMSFSKKLGGGFGTSVYSRNLAATWANKISQLQEYLERMISVHVECDEALEVIKRWDSPQTFFYCDPPYPETHQGHYGGYSIQDFQNLVEVLDRCEGSFLLSNYDQGIEMPADWERFEFQANASSSGKGKTGKTRDKSRAASKEELGDRSRTEIVWRRFNRKPIRTEIQALYDSGKFDCFASQKDDRQIEMF